MQLCRELLLTIDDLRLASVLFFLDRDPYVLVLLELKYLLRKTQLGLGCVWSAFVFASRLLLLMGTTLGGRSRLKALDHAKN